MSNISKTLSLNPLRRNPVRSKLSQLLAASAVLALTAVPASATTVFQDNFDGGTGDLNGTTPDTTTGGATWVAAPLFDANGDANLTDAGPGSATLAFTPVDGFVYTLEASFGDITTTPDGANNNDESWLALGFAQGQIGSNSFDARFIKSDVIGLAWAFQRGSGASGTFDNQAFLGDSAAGSNQGLVDGAGWGSGVYGGNLDLRTALDTTAGTGNWTATWSADTGSGFTEIRPTTTLLDESIDSVGIAASSDFVTGNIESFSLTQVPEPSSLALLGLGGLLIARRRRG